MKVENMTSSSGNKVANQFIITANDGDRTFQSYNSVIAIIPAKIDLSTYISGHIQIDTSYWDYSPTTGKYRNIFLGESKAETQKKINSGEYILTDLN